jgi:hypothetical protein
MKLARHAGTVVSAVSFAVDVGSSLREIRASAGDHGAPSPGDQSSSRPSRKD